MARSILTLERCSGFCIPGGLSRQTTLIQNPALAQFLVEVEELKEQHRDCKARFVRQSYVLKASCASVLERCGATIWPEQPARAAAEWLTLAVHDNLGVLYPIEL